MTGRDSTAAVATVAGPPGQAVVFWLGEVEYRWDEVFAYARGRNAWNALVQEVREARACQRMVSDEGLAQPALEERAAARAFRRERRLHAAEDLERWLAQRGLDLARWRDYLRGEALRRRHAADCAAIVLRYPPPDAEVRDALPAAGVCSGAFARWARELARRAAAAQAAWERDAGRGRPPGPRRLDVLDELADLFAERSAEPQRLKAIVSSRSLDWLRLDCEQAAFATEHAAREALLCVRDDGWSLAEAARAAGTEVHRHEVLVEELDDEARHQVLRAQQGELAGPLPSPAGPTLLLVRRRTAPTLQDPAVRARAVAELVGRAVAREVDDRVRWRQPL